MRTSKASLYFAASMALAAFLPVNAHALDAAKVLKGDASSPNLFQLVFGFFDEGKQDDAVQLLQYAADNGNDAARWKLAKLYESGNEGVAQNHLAAFKMYQKIAAEHPFARPNTPKWQFSADALVALGKYYDQGIPGTRVFADPVRARMMFTTAAMVFRHPAAQFELGRKQIKNDKIFGFGRSGVRNLTLAYEKGHVGAEALLGNAYFEGEHVRRDAVRGLVMLGTAKLRAQNLDMVRDLEWISIIHDEAFALARPDERAKAIELLNAQ